MGIDRFADWRIWLKKSTQTTDFLDKLNWLADFKNMADYRSSVNFGLDSVLYCFEVQIVDT